MFHICIIRSINAIYLDAEPDLIEESDEVNDNEGYEVINEECNIDDDLLLKSEERNDEKSCWLL